MAPQDVDLDGELAAIASGDSGAFARWLSGAEAPLRASLRSFAALADVEAILQEALLRVWQVAPRVRPDGRPNSLLRMAVTISRNLAASEVRRRRPEAHELEALERAFAGAGEVRVTTDPLLRAAIVECHRKLPGKPAQALAARLESAGGEPDAVLAERLGMRLNTFLQNFTRARKLLAKCLQALGVDLALEM